MKTTKWILPVFAFLLWGCTPAKFGFNVETVSALTDNPGDNSGNPILPPAKPKDHGDDDSKSDDDDSSSDDDSSDDCKDHDHKKPVELHPDKTGGHSCGKSNGKKVLICHVPGDDYSKQHTLCISVHGALNGHGVNVPGSDQPAKGHKNCKNRCKHTKDYLGPCKDQPPTPNPSPSPTLPPQEV